MSTESATDTPNHRGHLLTEQRNPRSARLDQLSTNEIFDIIHTEDKALPQLVANAKEDICHAVELVIQALKRGGRLIYVGAGTSGRLGVLDAAECPPTFLTDPSTVVGLIAGGDEALKRSIESAEDSHEAGGDAVDALTVGPQDVVFGIATGGTTPYVHGALARAHQRSSKTVFFACVSHEQVEDHADVSIRILTGPEVITGSTRMKAGTVTKMVLNMVSTMAMIGIGKVYENLMIDVNANVNAKLTDRGARLIAEITGVGYETAAELLKEADGQVKVAIVMHVRNVPRNDACKILDQANGLLRTAIESQST